MRYLAVTLMAAVLIAAPPATAQISLLGMTNSLVQFVLARISTPDSFEITAEGVEAPGDGLVELVGVRVADAQGVWLEIDGLGVNWNVTRILRGELEIRRLAARGVRVLRRPEPASVAIEVTGEPAPPPNPFAWPRSPIATRIDALTLTGVEIAAGVIAAQSLAFDGTGNARDEGDEQAVSLDVSRTDGVEGTILLRYRRGFAADTLDLDLDAREGPGGIVAALAGFPEDSGSFVTLRAEGPLSDWQVTVDAEADRVFRAEGGGRLAVGPPFALDAAFAVTPGAALDPTVAAALGARAELAARAREDADGVIVIEEGRLSAPDLRLTVDGRFGREDGAIDGRVDLAVDSGLAALVEGVDWGQLRFSGRVGGLLDDLTAEGLLGLTGLETAPADVGSAELDATITRRGERIAARLIGEATGLRLDRIGEDLLGRTELALDGAVEGGRITLDGLSLVSPLLSLDADGAVDLDAETASLRYALATPDLAPIAALYDLDAGGRVAVSGRLDGPLAAPRLDGEAALEEIAFDGRALGRAALVHDITLGETPRGRLSVVSAGSPIGPATLSADFVLDGRVLDVSDLAAEVLGVLAEGGARVDLETLLAEGRLDARIADLDPLAAFLEVPVAGEAALVLSLTSADGRQDAEIDATVAGLQAGEARLETLRLVADLRDALGSPTATGQVVIAGLDAADMRIDRFEAVGDARDLTGDPAATLRLDAAGITAAGVALGRASGEAAFAGLTSMPTGSARLDLADLLTGGAAVPTAALTLALTDDGGRLDAQLDASAPEIRLDGDRLGPVTLAASVRDAQGADPVADARLGVGSGTVGGLRLDGATVTARGPQSALEVAATVNGALEGETVALSLAGTVDAADPADIAARIARGNARYGEAEARLNQPMTVRLRDGIGVEGLDLAIPGGRLQGRAQQTGSGLAGRMTLALDDVRPLADLANLPLLGGALTLDADLDTTGATPRADARLSAFRLALTGPEVAEAQVDLEAEMRWRGERAVVSAAASGPFERPVEVALDLPLRRQPGGLPTVPPGGRLDGSVRWSGQIGDLWVLVPAPDHVLDGFVDADLTIGGTVASPAVGGTLSLTEGRYENLAVGTILTDLTVASTINPDGSFGLEATASDAGAGRVVAEAVVSDGSVRATVRADSAILVRLDNATAAVSLDILAEGPLTGPSVSGRVGIDRAEVNIAAALPPTVADIGPVRIRGEEPPDTGGGAGGRIPLAIRVEGDRNIFVRGRGLDSEWRVALDVGGTAAQPEVVGVIERVRGALNLVGFTFDLDTGVIRFTGNTPIDPTLDVRVVREYEGVTGGIFVTGTGSAPDIAFRSTPELPEDEVLPRVLFGQSQQSLTATQALLIAGGVAELAGGGSLLDGVRSTVGLDVLRIEDDGENGADVTVGQNVADGVFVGAKQSLTGGPARVVVEIEVRRNIIVDSETSGEETSVGINWRREF